MFIKSCTSVFLNKKEENKKLGKMNIIWLTGNWYVNWIPNDVKKKRF